MKIHKKIATVVITVGIIFLHTNLVHATNNYTISYANMGVDNIQIPAEYAVITRSDYFNTSPLEDEYGVDVSSIRANLNNSDGYVCAFSYDFEHEIDITFSEYDYALNIADLKDYSSDEIVDLMGADSFSEIDDLQVSYVDVGDNAAIKISGYISDLDQYCVQYSCTSTANEKNYVVLFKLYSYGVKPTTTMKDNLRTIVKNCTITSPETSFGMSREEAEKAVASDYVNGLLAKLFGGAIAGLIIGLIVHLKGRKNRKNNKPVDVETTQETQISQQAETNIEPKEEQILLEEEISATETLDSLKENLPIKEETHNKLFCRKCGIELLIDSEFCYKCGTKVIR